MLPSRGKSYYLFPVLLLFLLSASSGVPGSLPETTPIRVTVYKIAPAFYISEIPLPRPLQKYTYELCMEEGVDYELVLAVMWSESRFQADAVRLNTNGTRDSGLMQINDVNSDWMREEYKVCDLMDERQNIRAGVGLLARLVGRYGEHDGLMAYNLGETGMQRAKGRGDTTTSAVQKLLEKRDKIEQLEKRG